MNIFYNTKNIFFFWDKTEINDSCCKRGGIIPSEIKMPLHKSLEFAPLVEFGNSYQIETTIAAFTLTINIHYINNTSSGILLARKLKILKIQNLAFLPLLQICLKLAN